MKNIIIAILLIYIAFLNFKNNNLYNELLGTTQKYKQLSEHSASLEIKYETDLNKKVKHFKEEIKTLNSKVKILSNATFLIREKARELNKSDLIYSGKKIKYVFNEIKYNEGPPIGYILIFDDGRVVSKVYDHIIDVKQLVSRNDKSGKYNILARANYILKSPSLNFKGSKNWFNIPYPLKINGGSALVDPLESKDSLNKKFHWWNPDILLNANFDDKVSPGISIALSSYGKSLYDSDFKFFNLGIDYHSNKLRPNFVPILYRPLPKTLSNTYFGPGISSDLKSYNFFIGLQVEL